MENVEGVFQPQPSDVLIAVMGITGSGKSTFISHCTDQVVPIGRSLHSRQDMSDTQDVKAYRYRFSKGSNVYLIDTPGFDDTKRDDTEVLRSIAAWVTHAYTSKVQLRGILYLHRITDDRMQGASMKNLFMFKKLCGRDALKNVILVTTMWENVQAAEGEQREAELRTTPEFWGEMIASGSRVMRHRNNDAASAGAIVDDLLAANAAQEETLAIQDEMVNQNKDLDETSAGLELQGVLARERDRFRRELDHLERDRVEAMQMQDREAQAQIRLLQEEKNAEIARLQAQQESMKISLQRLHEEKYGELERRLREQEQLAQLQAARIEQLIAESEDREEKYKAEVEDLSAKLLAAELRRRVRSRPGRNRIDEGVWGLSMCGRYYHFAGPARNHWRIPLSVQRHKEADPGKDKRVALGPHGAYVRLFNHDGARQTTWSLDDYPGLAAYLAGDRMPKYRALPTLGPGGYYYVRDERDALTWKRNLPRDLKEKQLKDILRVWFGYNGAWVVKCGGPPILGLFKSSRRAEWHYDLKGGYARLERILKGEDSKYKAEDIEDMAMNIENDHDWVMVTKKGQCAYSLQDPRIQFRFEEYMTNNYGTTF